MEPRRSDRASLSVIIPLFNEEENVEPLCADLGKVLQEVARPFEILLIDDGSHDRTPEVACAGDYAAFIAAHFFH